MDDTLWTLVDGRSGRVIRFKNGVLPVPSPDGKWIAAKAVDDQENAGLSIMDNTGPKLKKAWNSTTAGRRLPEQADYLVWKDNDHILFPDVPGLTLTRTDGTWQLQEPEKPVAAPTVTPKKP